MNPTMIDEPSAAALPEDPAGILSTSPIHLNSIMHLKLLLLSIYSLRWCASKFDSTIYKSSVFTPLHDC